MPQSHGEKTITGTAFDLGMTLTCNFFLKS